MSINLTTALILLALALLGLVALQGQWVARRVRLQRSPSPTRAGGDGERREPGLADLGTAADMAAVEDDDLVDAHPPSRADIRPLRRSARLDPLVDAVATLLVDAPVTAEGALQHLPGSQRAGTKPFHVEGLNLATGEWESLTPGARYTEFQAGVQLANRNGPLNEIEFSEFVQKVEAFAQGLGAATDLPDMLEAVARARELDAFAGQHDAQLVAVLRANSVAWSVGYVQQIAQRHGFIPGAVPGRLVVPSDDDGAPPVLVLSFDPQAALAEDPGQAAVREVALGLDVAQTAEEVEPFGAWHAAARKLAEDLDASIVDDRGQPITLHAFSAIHTELGHLYEALAAQGLPAGSGSARRLFS